MPDAHARRARDLIRRRARRVLAGAFSDAPVDPPPPPPPVARDFARSVRPHALAVDEARATERLLARLDAEDVAEIERRIGEHAHLASPYRQATPVERRHLLLHFGVYLLVPAIFEKTGLRPEKPPEDVHAMARGHYAEAGGLYEADLVADALASVGVDIADIGTGLDFGCSSGRVVRVLDAAYPGIRWHACDPNQPAIAWAAETFPHIRFAQSSDEPPLALADGELDLAYAISIWSHFSPALGLRWFDELHRVVRPGGLFVMTTHGATAVDYYVSRGERTPEQSREIQRALYEQGWWYKAEFGEEGDWGVVNPDWGTAFLTPEWVLAQLTPRWQVVEFAAGRNLGNQDVYVLRRV